MLFCSGGIALTVWFDPLLKQLAFSNFGFSVFPLWMVREGDMAFPENCNLPPDVMQTFLNIPVATDHLLVNVNTLEALPRFLGATDAAVLWRGWMRSPPAGYVRRKKTESQAGGVTRAGISGIASE